MLGVFGEWKDRAVLGTKGAFEGWNSPGRYGPSHGNNWRFDMKMVKSLLLGSAAGLVAVSAGQAADLPVKAKPVEYVKVCSLYGAGFYYMPGTDICLKIGGYVRAETTYHSNGNFGQGPTAGDVNNRTTNEFVTRARVYITADAREQTAWGTARAYVAVGVATTDVGNALTPSILGFNRAFIQCPGSRPASRSRSTTSGKDLRSTIAAICQVQVRATPVGGCGPTRRNWVTGCRRRSPPNSGGCRRSSGSPASARPPRGLLSSVWHRLAIRPLSPGPRPSVLGYGGLQVPDIVGNIRLDQTWGSAQVMAAAHQVNATYYGCNTTTGIGAALGSANANGLSETGHPGDEWVGWGGRRRLAPELPEHRSRRLLPEPGHLYAGCHALHEPG